MCLHKEIREFILPITGKCHVFISHHGKTLYSYTVTGKMFYTYPITGKSFFNFIYIPSREKIIIIHVPSRESIRFISHLRKIFKFTTHRGKFSYSYPIQEIVHVHIPSRENKAHHKSANINCCIMNV
jgi:hypothetical protein